MTNQPQNTLNKLFEAGAHYGAMKARRHPSTQKSVFGQKNKLEIIDLEKTQVQLDTAKEFVRELGALGKTLLFVGNKNEARKGIEFSANKLGMPFVNGRWIGGTLTNFDQIRKRITRLADLEAKDASGELLVYTKKERSLLGFEMADLQKTFGGIRIMEQLPAAMLVVDSEREKIAVTEAHKIGIPVIAISNSDCDISGIEYPIVANDRSTKSINYFLEEIANSYLEGKNVKK